MTHSKSNLAATLSHKLTTNVNGELLMFYGETIQDIRPLFFSSWENYRNNHPQSPLEQQIAKVICEHPEYHAMLSQSSKFQDHTYYPELGETNPFLHMGLHLALREQVATNRPQGITERFELLLSKYKDLHTVEHLMMDQLAECLWLSQKNQMPPDEQVYLHNLEGL